MGSLGSPKGHLGPGGPMGPPERPHGPGTPWGSARPQTTPTPKVMQWSAYFFTFFSHFAHHPQNHTTKRLYFSYFFILFSHFGGHTVAGLFFHILFIFPRAFFSHFWGHPKNHPGGGLFFHLFFTLYLHPTPLTAPPTPRPTTRVGAGLCHAPRAGPG